MSIGHDIAPLVLNKKTDFFQEAVFVPLEWWTQGTGTVPTRPPSVLKSTGDV